MTDLSPDPRLLLPLNAPPPLCDARRRAIFCERLAQCGNVRLACKAAAISPQTAYRTRRACADFAALWDAALVLARGVVEEVLADRALNGVEEAVFYHGEEVARRRRYDSRLLLAHLARLDRLAERADTAALADGFDAALAALEQGLPLPERNDTSAVDYPEPADFDDLPDDDDGGAGDPAYQELLALHRGAVAPPPPEILPQNPVPGVPAAEIARQSGAGGGHEKAPAFAAEGRGEGGAVAGAPGRS